MTLGHIASNELFVVNSMVENNGTDFKDCEEFINLTDSLEDNWFPSHDP